MNFYYMWKKTRGYASTIQKQTEQQQNGKNNLNLTNGEFETTASGTNDDQNQNNETDSEDGNFTSNVTKICSNCDLITDDLQSTPKGVLCHPCYAYYKLVENVLKKIAIISINILYFQKYVGFDETGQLEHKVRQVNRHRYGAQAY